MLEGVTTTLEDVQEDFLGLVHKETILVWQSLENDLLALKIRQDVVIDTAVLFRHPRGRSHKTAMRVLTRRFLSREIQDSGNGHDSVEDARATLELVLLKIKHELPPSVLVSCFKKGRVIPRHLFKIPSRSAVFQFQIFSFETSVVLKFSISFKTP